MRRGLSLMIKKHWRIHAGLILVLGSLVPGSMVSFARLASAGDLPVLYQGTAHDAIYDVVFDGQQGIAVGAGGQVFTSADGGATWGKDVGPETGLALLGVAARGDRRVVVGQSGEMFRFEQGSWTPVDTGTDARLFSAALGDDGLIVVTGAFGTLLISHDDGESWRAAEFDWLAILQDYLEPHLYDVEIKGKTVTVVGEFGLVLRSTDAGETWAVAHRSDESLFNLTITENGTGLAVGQKGTILRTVDGGATWRQVATAGDANLLGVWLSGDRAFAVGIREGLQSKNAGRSWTSIALEGDLSTGWYQAVASAPSAAQPVLVGHSGRILALDH